MPKEEWGVKRLCPKCATRFYDLQKDPMTCPACGEEIELAALLNPGSRSVASKSKAAPKVREPVVDVDDAEVVLDDNEPAANDDDLLDDDDDTVPLEEIADVAAPDDDDN